MIKFLYGSFYSGIGGATEGAKQAGFQTLFAVDNDLEVLHLYQCNHSGQAIWNDVYTLPQDFARRYSRLNRSIAYGDNVLLFQISPSCKEFSNANIDKDPECPDAKSVLEVLPHIDLMDPEYIVLENVPAYAESSVYKQFREWLKDRGYYLTEKIIDCAEYGVPQSRRRLIMVASLNNAKVIAQIDNGFGPYRNWYGAIANLIPSMEATRPTPNQLKAVGQSGIGLVHYPLLVPRVGYRKRGPTVRSCNDVAPTLLSTITDDGKGGTRRNYWNIIYPDHTAKIINTRAAARIMGFPNDYQLSNNLKIDLRGLGNAVPPPVMKAICKQIMREGGLL